MVLIEEGRIMSGPWARLRDTLVFMVTVVIFQTLRYACHVCPRDKHDSAHSGDFIPAVAGGIQDSQHIVLGEGETVFPEDGGVGSFEVLCGSDNRDEHFFIRAQITDISFRVLGLHGVSTPEPA